MARPLEIALIIALGSTGCDGVFGLADVPDDALLDGCWTDRFDGPATDLFANWTRDRDAVGFDANQTGGELRLTLPSPMLGYAWVSTNSTYDLGGATTSVRVPVSSDNMDANSYLGWVASADLNYEIGRSGDKLVMRTRMSGSEFERAEILFDSDAHRYWQLGHRATDSPPAIVYATSADGVQWNEQHRTTNLVVPVTQASAHLGGGVFRAGSSVPSADVAFDDFVLCLP